MPVQFITDAKEYISRFRNFKDGINEDLEDIIEQLQEVKQKFLSQIHSEANKRGVLTSKLDDYLTCLDLGMQNLKKLFGKDERKWTENL